MNPIETQHPQPTTPQFFVCTVLKRKTPPPPNVNIFPGESHIYNRESLLFNRIKYSGVQYGAAFFYRIKYVLRSIIGSRVFFNRIKYSGVQHQCGRTPTAENDQESCFSLRRLRDRLHLAPPPLRSAPSSPTPRR